MTPLLSNPKFSAIAGNANYYFDKVERYFPYYTVERTKGLYLRALRGLDQLDREIKIVMRTEHKTHNE